MRLLRCTTAAAIAFLLPGLLPAHGQDASRSVPGGGITVPGWVGAVDAGAAKSGQTINDTKLAKEGGALQVTTRVRQLHGICHLH
jgi:hypothetical protein